jgi:hypothetical protein
MMVVQPKTQNESHSGLVNNSIPDQEVEKSGVYSEVNVEFVRYFLMIFERK